MCVGCIPSITHTESRTYSEPKTDTERRVKGLTVIHLVVPVPRCGMCGREGEL